MYVKTHFDARCYLTAIKLLTRDPIRRMLTASQGLSQPLVRSMGQALNTSDPAPTFPE